MDGSKIYDRLLPLVLASESQLEVYGFPRPNPSQPGLVLTQTPLEDSFGSSYKCSRCETRYSVDEHGKSVGGRCVYHPRTYAVNRSRPHYSRWSCCSRTERSATGCKSSSYHVNEGEGFLENYKNYVQTQPKPELEPNKHGVFAIDCEMCYTVYGRGLTRVTMIDHKMRVVYEELVKPTDLILDYNTYYSGITQQDLERAEKTLADVQRDLLQLISDKTILVGYNLKSDMSVLKMFHGRYIEIVNLYCDPKDYPRRFSLPGLKHRYCGMEFRYYGPGESTEDARAILMLAMMKASIVPQLPCRKG